jgi:hypothetical protein
MGAVFVVIAFSDWLQMRRTMGRHQARQVNARDVLAWPAVPAAGKLEILAAADMLPEPRHGNEIHVIPAAQSDGFSHGRFANGQLLEIVKLIVDAQARAAEQRRDNFRVDDIQGRLCQRHEHGDSVPLIRRVSASHQSGRHAICSRMICSNSASVGSPVGANLLTGYRVRISGFLWHSKHSQRLPYWPFRRVQ